MYGHHCSALLAGTIRAIMILPLILLLSACSLEPSTDIRSGNEPSDILTPLPFNEVQLSDSFWAPRLQTQIETLVPFALEKTRPAVENLEKTAKFLQGDTTDLPFPHRYICSDLYKVMEGAAYLLMINEDPALEKRMDQIIDIIAAAQREDGYLYVAHITGVANADNMGKRPYEHVVHSHELYNMGHMYEAAIAYYQATGKDKWLRVAEKNAQHINRVFFEGDPAYNDGRPVNQAPGHQEIELALAKLYRLTGKQLYLDMAERFLDIRGLTYRPDGEEYMAPTYAQQHLPVTEQQEAVGHAVRATYQYAGMADVGALQQTDKYSAALDHIWNNIVNTKMHITGGLGAMHGIEGFGPSYELPNKEAYNETCAAVGNVLFNFRMFLLTRDARYMDVAELALYNNVLAGVNLEGNRFFYVNPLEADGVTAFNHGHTGRSPWFNTACCPSNLARLIPQVAGMIYAYTGEAVYLSLYAGSNTILPLDRGNVQIRQETSYPFDGRVRLELAPVAPHSFQLYLRIPTWTGAQLVPGALYHYLYPEEAPSWRVTVNGRPVVTSMVQGYALIEREWRAGDVVELDIPMPVQLNRSIDSVAANRGRLAVSRGPLVYAAEAVDNDYPPEQYLLHPGMLAASPITVTSFAGGPLAGITRLSLPAKRANDTTTLRMIPYYAWNNRGDGPMQVWIKVGEE